MGSETYLAVLASTVAEPILSPRLATGHGVAGQGVGPQLYAWLVLRRLLLRKNSAMVEKMALIILLKTEPMLSSDALWDLWCDSGRLSGVEWSWERVRSATGCWETSGRAVLGICCLSARGVVLTWLLLLACERVSSM